MLNNFINNNKKDVTYTGLFSSQKNEEKINNEEQFLRDLKEWNKEFLNNKIRKNTSLLGTIKNILLGCIIFNNCTIQPQLTADFIISTNHFYSFFILSVVGFLTYIKANQIIYLSIYLIFLSFLLEIMHYIIPNRNFEYPDLFGNLAGVILPIVVRLIFKKNENFKN